VLSGGGIKSAVAAARAAKEYQLVFVHINYGQASANRESEALDLLVDTLPGSRVVRVALPYLSQLRAAASEGAAPTKSETRGIVGTAMTAASVPPAVLRGLSPVLLSVGLQSALRFGAHRVVVGLTNTADASHLGLPGADAPPDSRREFLHAFNMMAEVLLQPKFDVRIEAPLMDLRYDEVVKLALRFRVPLDKTWTCERFGMQACGKCEACRARALAFGEAGIIDPGCAVSADSSPVKAGSQV
jgi:7-cyano-7-deazaguanine synthase